MDTNGEDAVVMVEPAPRERQQDTQWRRTRLALACCVSCCLLLAMLSAYLLVKQLPVQEAGPQNSEMIAPPLDITEKPRAHLTVLAKEPSFTEIDGQFSALQWEDKNGLAFTEGQLIYQKPALIIPKKGSYFVYSQVSFRDTRRGVRNTTHITLIISKLTSSYPEPTLLLSSTRSLFGNQNHWKVTIYLGAIFQLQSGDRLVVNVSSVALVDITNDYKTYFGAFLL
ncbi:tumor necrosis factor ligand superfamily member 15-like [Hemiscyllium ocellatum]|uniref:tumor necrosis factor ligand superfamily member 15-like n=1 Tax=Hemiscyllium ocellatum TaxID=170820 RepID=UPI002966988B|nr:tumor necrosis factor ligand superfamily member 15-like [Hemiscyllium ocellatum]